MNLKRPLTYLLGQTIKLVQLKISGKFKENNVELSLEYFILLQYISQKENLTQQDLANHFLRDKSIILRQVNTLIELEYIKRLVDENDKRKKNLILTEKAVNFLQSARKLTQQISEELLFGVTEEEFIHFENVINKIQINTGFQQCLSGC
jgi:DNA-binding MarR family transcriptional regulator